MASPVVEGVIKAWPVATSVLVSAFAFGSLRADVSELKSKQDQSQKDHDAIVRIEQGQKDMQSDLHDIKTYLSNPKK